MSKTRHDGFQTALPRPHLARGVLAESIPKLHHLFLLHGQSTLGMMGLHRALQTLQHQPTSFNASLGERLQACGPFRQHLQFLIAIRKQLHNGLGRCTGPHIGHEINQTLISFVPNRANHGKLALCDRPDHSFIIEAPKIFHRSTTAGDQDGFDAQPFRIRIHRRNGFSNTQRSVIALHWNVMQQQFGRRTPQSGGSLHIGQGRRAFGRQDDDTTRKEWQILFSIEVKQTFPLKTLAKLGQSQQQAVATFGTFHPIHNQTGTTSRGVKVPSSRDNHGITRLGYKSDAGRGGTPRLGINHRLLSGPRISEGEVPVPTGVGSPPVGHLPPDRDGATAFQVSLDIRAGVFHFEGFGRRIVHDEDATLGTITGSPPAADPNAALSSLSGIGAVRAERLAALGLRTVEDLMRHRPLRWERQVDLDTIEDAKATAAADPKAVLVLHGEIERARAVRTGRPRFEAVLSDESGTAQLRWFGGVWLQNKIVPGLRVRIEGKATMQGRTMILTNPGWSVHDEAATTDPAAPLRPVYPATEGIPPRFLHDRIRSLINKVVPAMVDPLPDATRQRWNLLTLQQAIRQLHQPADEAEIETARRRLAFDELLALQLVVARRRYGIRTAKPATELSTNDALDTDLQALLPFALTGAQARAIGDIRQDLERPVPMHRLLQGDVGSGKTAVALAALLQCLRHGLPAAFMAPTELLAEQHHRTLTSLLSDRFTVHLCTGSRSVAERRTAADAAAAGHADLFVGTQALLSEHLGLQDAGLVVVDEQHRFGVRQRALLRRAEVRTPHLLVMTATPIPRSLALTHYGDLDVSILDELPPGRTPIRTVAMHANKMDAALARVGERVQEGEQAYIVVPAIEPGERGDPNLEELVPRLQQGPLADVPFGVVHGRLDQVTRDDTMAAFRDGTLRVLVATTVIEVGVDVPNASLMVILGADRFGLAQLHQLRGRVGRGAAASTCVLVADPATEDGQARIDAVVGTTDGFVIAEEDLRLRGPGEVVGERQSGLARLQFAHLPGDEALLEQSREEAATRIGADPELTAPEHAGLAQLAQRFDTPAEALEGG